MHGLEVPDLHGRRRAQDVGGLAHELRGFDFCAGGDDLGFSDPLRLGGHAEGVLELVAEDDVFDEHALDLDAPARGDVFDDFTYRLCDFFAALDDVLEDAGADDVAKGGLRALDEGLADVADTEGGFMGRGDVIVDDGGEVQGDVVFSHADLLGDLDDLDLDVDLDELLGQGVDLDKTGVDSAVEAAELGNETNIALRDGLVWIWANDAAGNSSTETDP